MSGGKSFRCEICMKSFDEGIAKMLESIPSGSSSEGEDSDADVDFVETGFFLCFLCFLCFFYVFI